MSVAYDKVRERLREAHLIARDGGEQLTARCPAHDDRNPSLSVRGIEGQVLMYCHAGCETRDIAAALALQMSDLFDDPRGAIYRYPGGRIVRRTPDKSFPQSGDKSDGSLYRSDRIGDVQTVYVTEGEKDVLAAEAAGAVAVCPAMGAGKASKFDWQPLKSRHVVVVADKDDVGRKHAVDVSKQLNGIAASVRIVEAATGKDLADHIASGGTLDDLVMCEPEVETPARVARITWAAQIEPEPVVWAWKPNGAGRIPAGSLCVAAGREGTGKSSFGIWMAAQITRGALPGSFCGKPRRVFYVAVEDSWRHTLVPRLIAAGADLSMVGRLEVVSGFDDDELILSLPHDNALLENTIRQHSAAAVFIDPLMSVIGERIDTHRERDVRSALDPLAKIADRTSAVILGIAHFSKSSGTDAASLITGSGAFKNVPRSAFGFARDEADEDGGRVMTQVKNSLGRDDLPSLAYTIEGREIETPKGVTQTGKFVFLGESDRSVSDVLRDSRNGPDDEDERTEAAAWLTDYLIDSGGEVRANDVIKAGAAAGYSIHVLKRAKKKINAHSTKSGNAWVWQLDVTAPAKEGSAKGAREREPDASALAPLTAPLSDTTLRSGSAA
ncbi:DNA primase [Mycobacterium marinum]|uniref:AAA family ATPase n=1 Tax=Mycobacterium marinum TaxID=1781 RepID=UPI000E3EC4FD|nr:AAA family ATPase [Mycobacterium marinum]RFZ48382.1 DNA primase [Mycobacterium marinum]